MRRNVKAKGGGLLRRDLSHYWRTSLAVTVGAAVACAVLTGALIVGESVRGSLRDLTLERLGGVDHAMAGMRFVPEDTAERLAADGEFAETFAAAAPAILLQGSALHADKKTRATEVGLQGVDQRFLDLFGHAEDGDLFAAEGTIFPPVVINEALAGTLGAAVDDQILISLRRFTAVPSGSLLSHDDTASVVESVRLQVTKILPDRELGAFGLAVHQSARYNAFVPLEALQKGLDQRGKVNAVVVSSSSGKVDVETGRAEAARLDDLLRRNLSVAELGLTVRAAETYLDVESDEFIIKPPVDEAVRAEAEQRGAAVFPVLTYLANGLRSGDAEVPYSTVTALDPSRLEGGSFGSLTLIDGSPAPALGPQDALINAWTAEQLGAAVGDELVLDYFVVGPREELIEDSHSFTIQGIVAMDGLGVDSTLTQEYPGIAGSTNMSDWDPPFPVDLGKIRDEDETYWDDYRGTPKAFVALETGRNLWRSRWGDLTTVRVARPAAAAGENAGQDTGEDADEGRFAEDRFAEDRLAEDRFAAAFGAGVTERLPLESFGLGFQPVKALGLGASGGATDFGGLFFGLSMFVIVSAALLVALLFGLATEQRAGEIGLRLATGYRPKQVRNLLLRQGGMLAVIGSLVGLAGAIGYAHLMMLGLRTWWLPAVGTSRLELHVTPLALQAGFLGSMAVVFLTIFLTVRKAGRTPTPQLLRGIVADRTSRTGRRAKVTAMITLGLAAAAIAYGVVAGKLDNPAVFWVAGPCLLIGLLSFFAVWIDRPQETALSRPGFGAQLTMALINSRRHRGRSLLSTTLVACAAFLIVTVAAYQEDFTDIEPTLTSGTGGYRLVAQSDVPLQQDLNSEDGRFELGLSGEADEVLADVSVLPMRLLPGDDTSCLNLYQPKEPRVLGVPASQIERGGFTFQQVSKDAEGNKPDNPWALLQGELDSDDFEGDVIPAIGDFNSTQWILKLPLGGELEMENERGEPVRLRLVASLKTSIFQSELLISEEQFLKHVPSRGGFPYFLIEASAEQAPAVTQALESELGDYGFDVVGSGEKLEAFHAVQNTYLSTFRTLGGLGLLLGTLGLAVVLVRNVMERRREMAALRAFGFRKGTLRRLVVLENTLLLVVGLGIGTVAALATAGAHVLHQFSSVPWGAIGGTLGAIFLVGWVACILAARGALRAELLPALKSDR